MSVRMLGARAVLACAVVLGSVALMAVPSWARSVTPGASLRLLAKPTSKVAKPTSEVSATPSATRPHWACPRERCLAIVDPPPVKQGSRYALPLNGPSLEGGGEKGGLDPADLVSAYKIPSSTSSTQTVAVVETFGYAAAESDLAKYRERYGLPECTKASGCFKRINVKGEEANYPSEPGQEAQGWQGESALDMDMVSAACPSCQIMMVEGTPEELELGVETAFNHGATEVSLSFGGPEQLYCQVGLCTPAIAREENEFYSHPGVPVTVASGDFAYNNESFPEGHSPSFPATVASVIAVGGTQLRKEANSRGWGELVWNDGAQVGFQTTTGSGCSAWFERPTWQGPLATGCEHRLDNDVAADAECRLSPVSVYSTATGGWGNFCGTSVSAPLLAGILAHASAAVRSAGARAFYQGSSVFDVTLGNDEFQGHGCTPILWCVAKTGYDGPTGNGTPDGVPVSVRPYVSKVEPTEGPESGGTSVTISGTGFEAGEAVYFGSAPASSVTIESPTSAKAVSPDGSGTVDVTLAGETVLDINRGDHFTYQARTDLSYSGPARAVDAQTVTLATTLTEHASHNPIAGRVVEFAVGAEQCQATTNASGLASCAVQINDAPGSYTLTAKVGAGAGYEEASTHVGFTVLAPPVFGRCLKAASQKVNGKVVYEGEFTTASCTATSVTKEGKYEWYPGPGPKAHFALAIQPATTIKIETRGKHSLICTAATGEGSVTGFNTVQMGLVLRGCSEEGEICGSPHIGAGEVKISRLDGTLAWQNRALNKVDLALTLQPALYECANKAVLFEADSILLPVTVNKVSTKATDKFTESKGIQVPDALEGGPPLVFEELRLTNYEPVTETYEETMEDAGLSATLLQTYEEGYEINAAF